MIRCKGHFWIATRPDWVGEISQAGAIVRSEGRGYWWCAIPPDRWPRHKEWREMLRSYWDDTFGDRRQEIVFVGSGMDERALRKRLDSCLVTTPEESGLAIESWKSLPDPFPLSKR